MINNINQLDINILDPINENMQKLLSTYQSSLIAKDEEKMSLER